MPKRILANFSPHPVGMTDDTADALTNFFGDEDWEVVGLLPVVPEIGNFEVVKSAIKLLVGYIRLHKPTHIYVSAHSVFDSLIYQAINSFSDLQVPRLLWDANRKKFWLSPPPLNRKDRAEIEIGDFTIPAELSEWACGQLGGYHGKEKNS